MTEKNIKRLPYGISNFSTIREENYYYVDKTRFIEQLENASNPYQFFIRPRKFGKSLFFSILDHYYDLNRAKDFERLFGDLYIGRNPTPKRNGYLMMQFDFSGISTSSEEDFKISFSWKVQDAVLHFISWYRVLFSNHEELIQKINTENPGINALLIAYRAAEVAGKQIFIIIDEYDHFANDLIAMGNRSGEDVYKRLVRANGLVRDFYETLKIATKTVLGHIFITGISPVMLDDLTSGFNIAVNLTLDLPYNEMMGFTQEEVDRLMVETGVDPALINVDMKTYYDGYLFHKDGENRVYNPSMMLYFFNQIIQTKKTPEYIIDDNLKTDYGRLQRLTQNKRNRDALLQIIKEEGITATIIRKFSIDNLTDDDYFVSLLFYMGLLTIKGAHLLKVRLGIPNYSIRTVFWEYISRLARDTSPLMTINTNALDDAIAAMAMEGDIHRYIEYVSQNAFSKLSDRDLQKFDEKYIQILLLSYLFQSRIYIPMSEFEATPGYTDIYLQRNPLLPQIKYEWILELKYCKTGEEKEVPRKREVGLAQLHQYLQAHRLNECPDLKGAVVVFTGKNLFEITVV
ncbi:MAG: ATP-binding protein [Dysgonamonadaceae bacterium]|jgi:hypothetical protein|nr:ATP-binding protein [Dysgonamonadaceae bacterium]